MSMVEDMDGVSPSVTPTTKTQILCLCYSGRVSPPPPSISAAVQVAQIGLIRNVERGTWRVVDRTKSTTKTSICSSPKRERVR
jgi:hypothetical protein